ncbi:MULTISPECIES: leucine-rich repeat domain-containing protein [Clostridium]|uniref:Leucine-rich repeat domain-containing protein n=1 Tax=Clostridium cibarium TaxID=2762247 RepID=A0ABR8PYE6_9CLOT|nr:MULTISPECIES: leucine-rich repeat domain-containing protein [Clostridium]MBD7913187.1 leucine-rich repeat domain-containing protein [Clostridium cibarium]
MLKKEKRIIIKLLLLTMCTSLMVSVKISAMENKQEFITNDVKTLTVNKEKDFTFDEKTGTITNYIGTDTTVVIPSRINGISVINIGREAFYDKYNITSVIIPDSVTNIEEEAFCECAVLRNVVIGNNVTNIGVNAFSDCINLKSLVIPDSVSKIGDFAFFSCNSLTSVEVGKGIINIGSQAFSYCSNAVYYVHGEEAEQLLINAGAEESKIILKH